MLSRFNEVTKAKDCLTRLVAPAAPTRRMVRDGNAAKGEFSRVVSRVNGLLRSTCLKAAPFRSDSQFDHDVRVTPIYKWMERARGGGSWLAGFGANGGVWDKRNARIHPTTIRRVAVIEVIAILCPVRAPVQFSLRDRSISSPSPAESRFSAFIVLDAFAVSSLRIA